MELISNKGATELLGVCDSVLPATSHWMTWLILVIFSITNWRKIISHMKHFIWKKYAVAYICTHTPFNVWQICYFILNAQGYFWILNPIFFQSWKLLRISSWLERTYLKSKFVRIGRNKYKELYLKSVKAKGCFFPVD